MIFGVDVNLFNRDGIPYRTFGLAEYEGIDAETKAMEYAYKRVGLHRNASACIMLNGDPYAWVSNGTTDYAGVTRRDTDKPRVDYIGRATPDEY
jgi:hypothetical protein